MGKKSVVWPAYLDSEKSRGEGRRVPRKEAIDSPTSKNVCNAAKRLGLNPEHEKGKKYPGDNCGTKGRVLVDKKGSKNATLKAIAREMRKER